MSKLFLACYFGEHLFGAEYAVKEVDKALRVNMGSANMPVIVFVGALCCFAEAGKPDTDVTRGKLAKCGLRSRNGVSTIQMLRTT